MNEIARHRNLSIYGAVLSLLHVWTWISWSPLRSNSFNRLATEIPICWSYFPSCDEWRPLVLHYLSLVAGIYLLLGLLSAVSFAAKKTKIAYWIFLLAGVVKWIIISIDYHFMGNYHYMHLAACLFFLFVPGKSAAIKKLIVGFYLGAGLLKFGPSWLSGTALLRPPVISGAILDWALAYVVVLETIFAPLLLCRDRRLFYFAFVQILIFHLFSWHIVDSFYPITMFGLLSIFVIPNKTEERPHRRWISNAALGLFAALQLIPLFLFPESSLTGEGRILALNMLDASTTCNNRIYFRSANRFESLGPVRTGVRIRCDPAVQIALIRRKCRELKDSAHPDFDFYFWTRRLSDKDYKLVVARRSVCARPLRMNFLGGVTQ